MTEIPFRVEDTVAAGTDPLEYERPRSGRVRLTVRAGERRTGGHRVEIVRITRDGPLLTVHAVWRGPAPGAIVTQVLTSPAVTVSVDERAVRGTREAVLVDDAGREIARVGA